MNVIVCTTINPPTEAIRRFDAMSDWELVVIGDLKTPRDYSLSRGTYVGPETQEQYDKPLSDAIGWNCIQRRNFGLLWARDMGADIVAVVDDDNIPYNNWGKGVMIGRQTEVNYYETELPAFDPVGATNHGSLWHRGFPLQLLPKRDYSRKSKKTIGPQIQADFWNGDPDIDAVCRMEHAPVCDFGHSYFPIAANSISPFNSQNTFLAAELLNDYFLFPHVGRMDDIWASYYVQAKGASVVYGAPSVFQERNVHNPVRDMQAEYIGYENNLAIVEGIGVDPDSLLQYVPGRSIHAFRLYRRHFDLSAGGNRP
jgi:hypothetical protein